MKYFAIALVASVLGSALCASIEDRSQSGNGRVLDLVKAAFSYASKVASKWDPIPLSDLYENHSTGSDPQYDLVLTQLNRKIAGVANVSLENIETDDVALTAKFLVVNPEIQFNSDYYEVFGTALNRNVSGSGPFRSRFMNVTALFSVRFEEDPSTKALSIPSLSELYNISSVVVDLANIQVEGVTKEETEAYVEKEVLKYFYANKGNFEKFFPEVLRQELNDEMYGMTMAEVTQWLKENTPKLSSAAILKALGLNV